MGMNDWLQLGWLLLVCARLKYPVCIRACVRVCACVCVCGGQGTSLYFIAVTLSTVG